MNRERTGRSRNKTTAISDKRNIFKVRQIQFPICSGSINFLHSVNTGRRDTLVNGDIRCCLRSSYTISVLLRLRSYTRKYALYTVVYEHIRRPYSSSWVQREGNVCSIFPDDFSPIEEKHVFVFIQCFFKRALAVKTCVLSEKSIYTCQSACL